MIKISMKCEGELDELIGAIQLPLNDLQVLKLDKEQKELIEEIERRLP